MHFLKIDSKVEYYGGIVKNQISKNYLCNTYRLQWHERDERRGKEINCSIIIE